MLLENRTLVERSEGGGGHEKKRGITVALTERQDTCRGNEKWEGVPDLDVFEVEEEEEEDEEEGFFTRENSRGIRSTRNTRNIDPDHGSMGA